MGKEQLERAGVDETQGGSIEKEQLRGRIGWNEESKIESREVKLQKSTKGTSWKWKESKALLWQGDY